MYRSSTVERPAVNRDDAGSNPTGRAKRGDGLMVRRLDVAQPMAVRFLLRPPVGSGTESGTVRQDGPQCQVAEN
jgi:hypothetical protein